MSHNPRHGADPGVTIGSSYTPPSQPTSPMDFFGSMFTAPGSSTANVTGTSEEADKGTSGPGIFGFRQEVCPAEVPAEVPADFGFQRWSRN
jgi:hypothetical protein